MKTDGSPRVPMEACRQFMPHCLPCPYRVGCRAVECTLLADYYAEEKEFSRRLGVWALQFVQKQAMMA